MTAPSFSIITPSYNQAEFIRDTICSVQNQSYRGDIRHIVVDGGSDDGTLDILREYDEYVDWTSEPDEGQSHAINKGFERASGDIIGWLNSDDVYFDTDVFSRVADYFDRFDADIVYGDMALIGPFSDVLKLHIVPDFDYRQLFRGCFIVQPSLFFRREVIKENRLDMNLEYVMDYEFWLRLDHSYKFKHVSDVLAGDRNHPQRKILNQRKEMKAEGRKMVQEYGGTGPLPSKLIRPWDILVSGIPRLAAALYRTYELHNDPPELAFNGELCPPREMYWNVLQPNRNVI